MRTRSAPASPLSRAWRPRVTDRIVVAWQELPRRVNASTDFFIRTTDEGHKRFVQDFLQRIYDNGDVYQDVYAGLYCVGCEAFKTEDELVDGKCPDHGVEPEWLEENWFFRLSAYQDSCWRSTTRGPDFVLPDFRANEARSFIAGGLRDFSISRARRRGASRSRGIRNRSPTSGPTRSSTTWARSPTRARASPAAGVLARRAAPDRPGHHPLPLRLLAGAAAVGRLQPPQQIFAHGAPAARRPQDLQIDKGLVSALDLIDVYGADAVRFWCARAVSFGRTTLALDEKRPRPLRAGARQRPRQPALAHDGDARSLQNGALPLAPSTASPVAGALEPLGADVAERLDRLVSSRARSSA